MDAVAQLLLMISDDMRIIFTDEHVKVYSVKSNTVVMLYRGPPLTVIAGKHIMTADNNGYCKYVTQASDIAWFICTYFDRKGCNGGLSVGNTNKYMEVMSRLPTGHTITLSKYSMKIKDMKIRLLPKGMYSFTVNGVTTSKTIGKLMAAIDELL